jgi:ankyrin repeat protein
VEPIFRAVLQGREEVARLLLVSPERARLRMPADQLVKSIPHWLYIDDTSLHLAAAALRPEEAQLLLQAGADPNAQNRRGATPVHYCCDPRPHAGFWSREAQTKRASKGQ